MIKLTVEEIRVLGSLVEKEKTTPDNYPITLNSLILACNQKSNREPVMNLIENEVLKALDGLRDKKLVWECVTPGSRVPKFQHQFSQNFNLNPPESAIIAVLMLRGPQTIGELKSRCFRLHEFSNLSEVESTLNHLANREDQNLVVRLPRQPGRKECRMMHLLGDSEEILVRAEENEQPGRKAESTAEIERERVNALECTVEELSQRVETLNQRLDAFIRQFE